MQAGELCGLILVVGGETVLGRNGRASKAADVDRRVIVVVEEGVRPNGVFAHELHGRRLRRRNKEHGEQYNGSTFETHHPPPLHSPRGRETITEQFWRKSCQRFASRFSHSLPASASEQ